MPEDEEKKLVKCLNCGNVWKTKAKRPQCSVCKSTKVKEISKEELKKLKGVESAEINVDQHVENSESTNSTVDSTLNQHVDSENQHDVDGIDDVEKINVESTSSKQDELINKLLSDDIDKKEVKKEQKKEKESRHTGALWLVIAFIIAVIMLFLSMAGRTSEEMAENDESGQHSRLSVFG